MPRLARLLVLWLALVAALSFAQETAPALRLRTGDVIVVNVTNVSGFSGEYPVLSDGSVSGAGFGRVVVAGKTLSEAQASITAAIAKRIKDPRVEVLLKSEFPKAVYFVGTLAAEGNGVAPWQPGMTLQSGLAQVKPDGEPDLLEVTLYRGKNSPQKFRYLDAVQSNGAANSIELQPGDVISILPAKEIRVWVLGHVMNSGEMKIREGSDLYEALAKAGGLERGQGSTLPSEYRAVLRRGDDQRIFPAEPKAKTERVTLEPGDTIFVEAPGQIKVTVAGEVVQPGEFVVRLGAPIEAAIAAAKGKTGGGTLENVLLFRNGEVQVINASGPGVGVPNIGPTLQSNDLIVVQRSQKLVYALGHVNKPSAVVIPDGLTYRVSDVLSQAGGISSQGTLRRVVLIRPDKDGKLAIKEQFNLDEFLKDGKMDKNPIVQPGDVLYFGQPQGVTAQSILQGASAAVLLETLFRFRF